MEFFRKHYTELGLFLIRFFGGMALMMHGQRKLFVNGLDGFTETVASMGFPLPGFFAWLAALSEFLGGICLALGVGTRYAALFVAGTMFVAAFIRHAGDSFFAREKSLFFLSIAVGTLLTGGGRYSLDYYLRKWRASQHDEGP